MALSGGDGHTSQQLVATDGGDRVPLNQFLAENRLFDRLRDGAEASMFPKIGDDRFPRTAEIQTEALPVGRGR
jgi:hypothetical protein